MALQKKIKYNLEGGTGTGLESTVRWGHLPQQQLFGSFLATTWGLLLGPIVTPTICGNNRQFEILIEPFVRFVSLFVDICHNRPSPIVSWEYRKIQQINRFDTINNLSVCRSVL